MAEVQAFERSCIEETVFPPAETPYDEYATYEVMDPEPGRFQQLFQDYGRKIGAVILAGRRA